MPKLEWILASVVSWSGFRLDVLFVRVVRAGVVLFAGVAMTVSPPVARLGQRVVIDTVGEPVHVTEELADVLTIDAMYELAA